MRREALIAARKKAGKNQERVAEEVGVDRTTVSSWERGEYSPQLYQRQAYAESLGVSLGRAVRDSKLGDGSPVLRLTRAAVAAWLAATRAGAYDELTPG